jgi:imidazolonepropionase-like amidohydrolase
VTTPHGHCWFLGGEADGRAALLRAVEERAERGCQVVKVMASGGNITPGNSPFESQFDVADLTAIVDEAHRLGLQTAAHVHAGASVVDALDAGFDTLEHVTFMAPDGVRPPDGVLQRLADSDVVVSVTAGNLPDATPPPAIAARLDAVRENMAWLAAHGARMVAGSDAGVGPGKPHGVLPWALVDLGLLYDGLGALRAVTSTAADALGLAGRKGRLIRGADADLLAVRGDPTTDSRAIHDVVGVWAGGRPVLR